MEYDYSISRHVNYFEVLLTTNVFVIQHHIAGCEILCLKKEALIIVFLKTPYVPNLRYFIFYIIIFFAISEKFFL